MEKTEVKRKLKHEKKGIRGITLIALVVTIIVLLILAGVSIQMLTGENGILKRATQAREATDEAAEQEQRDFAKINAMMSKENVEYTDKNGDKAMIPAGFALTGIEGESTIKEGLVITDGEGNEFVWVPCLKKGETEERKNAVKYEKDKSKVNNNLATKWKSSYSGKEYEYTKYQGWRDNGGDEDSVEKYGGLYVARYEAGVSSEAIEIYASENGDEYKTVPSKNVNTYKPVSKKNNQNWNYISQINAKTVSTNMYSDSNSVTSQLIDSYAWDTIVEWMNKEVSNVGKDSSNKGNYLDSTSLIANGLYAVHAVILNDNTETLAEWCPAIKYKKGLIKLGRGEKFDCENTNSWNYSEFKNGEKYKENYCGYKYKEIATGSCEETKIKNIYDMAGNMWEWTTETGNHQTTEASNKNEDGSFAVIRGGSYNNDAQSYPVSFRQGYNEANYNSLSCGFRVVLYIK